MTSWEHGFDLRVESLLKMVHLVLFFILLITFLKWSDFDETKIKCSAFLSFSSGILIGLILGTWTATRSRTFCLIILVISILEIKRSICVESVYLFGLASTCLPPAQANADFPLSVLGFSFIAYKVSQTADKLVMKVSFSCPPQRGHVADPSAWMWWLKNTYKSCPSRSFLLWPPKCVEREGGQPSIGSKPGP